MEQLRAQLNGTECTVYVGAGLLRRTGGPPRGAAPPRPRRGLLGAQGLTAPETHAASLKPAPKLPLPAVSPHRTQQARQQKKAPDPA